jgi:DNA-binding transcriptional MerR regulator
MRMTRRTYRIGTLAHQLGVERFVIRFWEKEFAITSGRTEGGQRCYTEEEMQRFYLIKELLYQRKFTIAGAKEYLSARSKNSQQLPKELLTTFHMLKRKLIYLRSLL